MVYDEDQGTDIFDLGLYKHYKVDGKDGERFVYTHTFQDL